MIKTLTLGHFAANCYIYYIADGGQAVIIDPGDEPARIKHFLKTHELTLTAVLLTHGHIDHIGALQALKDQHPLLKVYIHEEDLPLLTSSQWNLSSRFSNTPFTYCGDVIGLKDDECLSLLDQTIICLHYPGHTPGSCMFCFEPLHVLFSGDVLFAGSIGRYDLPLGSHADTKKSLVKIVNLEPNLIIYPGHGTRSTIASELENNPFLVTLI